jgi:DNA-binding NarL/FixJ family response regulator
VTALVERHGHPPAARPARFSAMVVVANPFVREAVVRSLQGLGARDVVEAASLAEARARARADAPRDLCVIDGTLPDVSGIALVTELRAVGWSRGVLLSSAEDPYTVRAALAAGVRAFLVSPAAAPSNGVRPPGPGPLPPQRAGAPRKAAGAEGLSAREVEVLQLVGDGRSNKEIGEVLGLSALTVKSHLARIARKLGTGDRAEMVVVAMRAGVVA